jgi:hypothetical protein
VTLTSRVVGGSLMAGDDFDAAAWEPFPELAYWYDAEVRELYCQRAHCPDGC